MAPSILEVIADLSPPLPMGPAIYRHLQDFAARLKQLCQARGGVYGPEVAAVEQAEILFADGHWEAGSAQLWQVLHRIIARTLAPMPGAQVVDGLSVRALACGWSWQYSPLLTPPRALRLYGAFVVAVETVPGDIAEFGVAAGQTARELLAYLHACADARGVHLFDTFTGLPAPAPEDRAEAPVTGTYAGSMAQVRETLAGLDGYTLYPGPFAVTTPGFDRPLAFAHIDADLYTGTRQALAVCARCLVEGGIVVVDDDGTEWEGVTRAVDEVDSKDWLIARASGQAILQRRTRR